MNEKDKAIAQAMASIQNRLRHVYNQGFEDGRKAERKTGKWIDENGKQVYVDKDGFVTDDSCTCSECGAWLVASDEYLCRGRYCPNCGAKMEVDE